VGCFAYSEVEGAQANALPDAIAEEIKQERRKKLMEVQEEISRGKLERKIGKTLTVLVDVARDGRAIARSSADAPEIEGVVHIEEGDMQSGEFARVVVTSCDAHDLRARIVDRPRTAKPPQPSRALA
jgi:ribosomal protein S12 methylthiotransferase